MVRSDLFREVFEQSNFPQVLTTVDLGTTIFNKAFYDFFGYSKEEWEVQAISVRDVSHPEDFEKDYQLLQELINGQRSFYQIEKRYYHKSGKLLFSTLNVSLISDPKTGARYIFAQVIDTTEKNLMTESLRISEKQYRLLAEYSSDMIMLHDVDGRYKYVSPSFKTLLGYDTSNLIGANPYDFIHPDDIPRVQNHLKKLTTSKVDMPLISYKVKKADQTYIWIESSIKGVFHGETGELTELISVSRDIQQRVETYELLKKSERLAIVGRMAAAVAHEIRNPLTPIKGFITLLSTTEKHNPMFVDVILSEIERIELIISEFLSVAKPNNHNKGMIHLDRIVLQVVNLIETEALLNNKQISVQIDAIPQGFGDENSLKQVFLNVLRNALESIEKQGIVAVHLYPVDDYTCIKISDNGCGISKERLAKIGEPFYSTKEKGTGLGLMTSINIIENHHGKIDIESEEGEGTTVKIYLPVQ